jgi:pimeloyl-ACP methyl ester carboxylesterase
MIENLSLIHGWFPPTLVVVALVALTLALSWDPGVLKWQLGLGVPITGALVGLTAILVDGLALIPYQFPNSYYLWVGLAFLALVVSIIGWVRVGNWRRLVMVLSVVLTALMAMNLINQHYQYYPTAGSLFGVEAQNEVSPAQLDAIRDRAARENGGAIPTSGFTIEIDIPGAKSGFVARKALVWVPPKWVADKKARLPLLVLMPGIPGAPDDWTRAGFADQTALEFASRHDGVAPIIVMPDENGSASNDTECVNSRYGQAETYLTVDVPAFMQRTFGATLTSGGKPTVALAGLSEGGMCAAMLTLRHPEQFAAFADFSGLTAPTLGYEVQPRETTQTLFNGDDQAYDQHNIVWLLQNRRFPTVSGWFQVGTQDTLPLRAQRELVPLAVAAGLKQTCSKEVPGGGHNFDTWSASFKDALPWLSFRVGLTDKPDSDRGATCVPAS